MTRFPKQLWFPIAVCALFLLGAWSAIAQSSSVQPRPKHPIAGPEVTTASLRPIKTRVGQPCPTDFTLYGEVYTNGATTVKYTWVSSDGAAWPTRNLKFTSATHEQVTEKWKVGAPGKKVNKWLQLQILSPNRLLSNKIDLDFTCGK